MRVRGEINARLFNLGGNFSGIDRAGSTLGGENGEEDDQLPTVT